MILNSLKTQILKGLYIAGLKVGINRDLISVLCYHSVSNSSDEYSVSLSNFKKQIKIISRNSKFINLRDLKSLTKNKKFKGWGVILTIDDGYEDVNQIIPTVKLFQIPTILFVMSNRVKANRSELNNSHKLLTLSQIKKLHKLGWEIGCHSATHADLSKLDDEALTSEIIDSKKNLERQLGFKVNYFAYPKGIVNSRILKHVKKAGYKLAFTTAPGVINSDTNPLLIPRTVVNKSRAISEFPYFFSETGLYLRSIIENAGIWKALSLFHGK